VVSGLTQANLATDNDALRVCKVTNPYRASLAKIYKAELKIPLDPIHTTSHHFPCPQNISLDYQTQKLQWPTEKLKLFQPTQKLTRKKEKFEAMN
jgi:hypothetical protein